MISIFTNTSSRRIATVMACLLLLLTTAGVTISTTHNVPVGPAQPAAASLTVDEQTYYEYVAPRLDRLVTEVNDVVEMVNNKSRDFIALTLSSERIETLTDEIMEYGELNGVPQRFQVIHQEIADGTGTMLDTFDEARSALKRLNFSKMSTLIDKFNGAAAELHRAQTQMQIVAGSDKMPEQTNQGSH